MTASTVAGVSYAPPAVAGQLPGTRTNDVALAGNVGEIASATLAAAAALVLSSGVGTTIVVLPLSAGDWDVWGQVVFTSGVLTVATAFSGGVNSTAVLPSLIGGGTQMGLGGGLTGIATTAIPVNEFRVSLAAAGTAFLMANMTFSVSTAAAYGAVFARRMR